MCEFLLPIFHVTSTQNFSLLSIIVRTEILTTILAAQTFGVRHLVVLKHTDCGGYHLSGSDIINHFKSHAKDPKAIEEADEGRLVTRLKEFGFGTSTIEEIVLKDVEFLKKNPLIYEEMEISGWVLDDVTGQVSIAYLCTPGWKTNI
jgi:carbonic anhydrase